MASKVLLLALLGAVAALSVNAGRLDAVDASGRSLLQANLRFPYCRCDDRLRNSPWRLKWDGPLANVASYNWICFKIYTNFTDTRCTGPVDSQPACCKPALSKLEFNVEPDCKGTVTRAMVNKNTADLKTVSIDKLDNGRAILRLSKGLDYTASTLPAGGLSVCFNVLKDQCTLSELFMSPNSAQYALFNSKNCCPAGIVTPPAGPSGPAPRPTPTPNNFPYCNCATYGRNSFPWRVSVLNKTTTATSERVCLKLYVDPAAAAVCNDKFGCCRQGLQKIELEATSTVPGQCKGSISPFTLTGTTDIKSSFLWDSTRPVLKFTKLDLSYSQGVAGAALCFNLKGPGCTRLNQLCTAGKQCPIAVFNGQSPFNTCCPAFFLDA
ncbi:hypothetical protein HYH02_008612 [Chlamydomonas schloesseri]|uniref:Pherophorin domain-containing protein n=1 Tax=Chlamydomonas schloesseri TaxID=2026947 RepID=A0A835WD82_9CHLO|nr:hypothetical protein HYH02_008612 [Chlamydomonas schloesseri]|eukprot:KAG2445144.1 hypothetical protein HYH02_008612 [Chlamydomonas schloesseri]